MKDFLISPGVRNGSKYGIQQGNKQVSYRK